MTKSFICKLYEMQLKMPMCTLAAIVPSNGRSLH